MSMYYLNPETGKYEKMGAPHVDVYSKEQTDALIAENAGITMELLWENASPASAFGEQTISLDLSQFDMVMIRSINQLYQGSAIEMTSLHSKGGVERKGVLFCMGQWAEDFFSRVLEVNNDGINFGWSRTLTNINSGEYMKPTHIYGVKGVTIHE